MITSRPRIEIARPARWLGGAALFALVPKCLLCVLGYTGLATALGFGGPEICGSPASSHGNWAWSFLALGGVAGAVGVTKGFRRLRS